MPSPFYLWRSLIYSTLFVGYFLYFLNRKSFSFLMPYVIQEDRLSPSELGAITSSISLAYTISKFISGILSDRISARFMFSSCLLLVSSLVLFFTSLRSLHMFMLIWFVNGLAQGGGWPSCSKLLKQWFLPSELGLFWSVLSASANLAGVLGPIGLAFIAKEFGWRLAMNVGGILGLMWAAVSFIMIKNSPSAAGLVNPNKTTEAKMNGATKPQTSDTVRDVISSPFLWVISVLFFMTALGAYGIMDWGQLYLIQDIGFENAVGSAFTSSYSIGAIAGSVLSGFVTDQLVAKANKNCKSSPRIPWFLFMEAVNLLFIHIFRSLVTIETNQMFILAIAFVLGLAQYSAFSIYGVIAVENAPVHLSGTSHAFVAMACNVGVLISGYPLTYLAERFNWQLVLTCLEATSLTSLLILISMRKMVARIGKPSGRIKAD